MSSGDHELDSVCMSVGIGSVFEHGWVGRVCDSVCENVKIADTTSKYPSYQIGLVC